MNDEILVGIDLGTTNSAIARLDEEGRPEVIPNAEGAKTTPSVVQIRPDGSVLVGRAAKQEAAVAKDSTAQFFKRDMGGGSVYEFHGRAWTPVDLSAEVLRKVKVDAERHLGRPIRRAVITVPAYFQNAARLATIEAGRKAGLEVLRTINEPTAAAVAYGLRAAGGGEVVMVYDLGGGTFDISLVRLDREQIEVIGSDGNHFLGGKNWDDRLVRHACEQFRLRHGEDPLDDPSAFQEILIRAEELKEALTGRVNATVTINCFHRTERVEITRDEFEAMTADLLAQTEHLIEKVLHDTGMDTSRVSSVLMVGGSTRMPMCGALVERLTGKTPNTGVNPDECVAIGAAIQASVSAGGSALALSKPGGLGTPGRYRLGPGSIRDVMSHSMGMIAISPDGERHVNSVLIPKNRPIPCRDVRPYEAEPRGAPGGVSVYVTQGEGDDVTNVSYVGKFVIEGIACGDARKAVLDIAYEYDESGVVKVSAVHRSSGVSLRVNQEEVPEDMSWVQGPPRRVALLHKTVYLAIDLSGSMSGEPLDRAKVAIMRFLDNTDLAHGSVGLIKFADRVRTDVHATQDGTALRQAVQRWRIGDEVGGCNDAEPFSEALSLLGRLRGPRYVVVLTDGVWSDQPAAIRRAKACHEAGIEVVAIGFGGADDQFLRRIATSDESALFTGDLTTAFENIARVLVESDGGSLAIRRL